MKVQELPPGLGLTHAEDASFVTLVWVARAGTKIGNPPGVSHEHVTRCLVGRVRFTFRDDRSRVTLNAGQQTRLPVGRGYDVVALLPSEVRCFYPKDTPGAVEAIEHLRVTLGDLDVL